MRTTALVLILLVVASVISFGLGRSVHAQEPLRFHDIGTACLYMVDTGGLWGITKRDLGLAPTDPCPRQQRR